MAKEILVSVKKNGKIVSMVKYNGLVFRAESLFEKTNAKVILAIGKTVEEIRPAYDKEIASL